MWHLVKEKVWFVYFHALHRLSLSRIEAYQIKRLNELISYVRKHVPMYRELYASLPKDFMLQALSDMERLPIITKDTFRSRTEDEFLDASRGGKLRWLSTSGTSGEPFSLVRDKPPVAPYIPEFLHLRFLHWKGLSLGRCRDQKIASIKVRSSSGNNRLFVSVAEYLHDPEKHIERLVAFAPDVLMSYSSILFDLAERAKGRLTAPSIVAIGEMLSPSAREKIQEALGGEVYMQYGMEEVGSIGVECRVHDGYHVHVESIFLEALDEDGKSVPQGESGRIVVTDLFNFRMPFIRYETGDRGTIRHEQCACGLRSPRVWIEGRYTASLTFGGRNIHHLEFDAALDTYEHSILKYQIVKKSDTEMLLKIVPGPLYSERMEEEIREKLSKLLGAYVEVRVEKVGHIEMTGSGKSKIVSDESNPR